MLCLAIKNYFNSFYILYIINKQTNTTIYNKKITKADKKIDKIHVDLWGLHYLAFLLRKKYTGILLDAKIWKTWIIYLQSKNKFLDKFQIWLSRMENKYKKLLKIFYVDGKREFILAKLKK